MTTPYPTAPGPCELWEGEVAAVLAEAAEVGRRAAAWVRSLPGPPVPSPVGAWLAGELPDVVEAVMGGLDPQDCDHMAPDGRTGGSSTAPAVPIRG
ncbi:hypothetical protein ACUN3E_33590 [Streptomyces sp. Ju416(a)]|uniref:hypothetical protein n=1 Tax=Streptomyces sp. Ju416(a) TaxID=3446591 RepID=UPI00403DC4FF